MADSKQNPMTGLMDQIQASFERGGLKTDRQGNQVNVLGMKKDQKPQPALMEKGPSKQSLQEAEDERIRRLEEKAPTTKTEMGKKKGGVIKSSASRRADGIAQRGKTRGRVV